MPEGLEAEIWRRAVEPLVGRSIERVWVDDRVADPDVVAALTGRTVEGVRRHGKVLAVDTDGRSLGLHFGMTGRVIVDGVAPIERLEYSSGRDDAGWDRLRITTHPSIAGGVGLRLNDPRRLGRVSLDPDFSALGADIFSIDADNLSNAVRARRAAIKSVLLDQRTVAGLGNLCADEMLWWADISPLRAASDLDADDVGRLVTAMSQQLPKMLERGGSTSGVLSPELRAAPGHCPRDGALLRRATLGGRTAVWCPTHQV